jgi:spermidine synthase
MRERLLILSVFVVASCGLAYELITGALASYLLGDSVLQFSSIIGCYLFAMGVGSHLSQYVKDERVLDTFVEIELLVGLIGGLSASVLFVVFAWTGESFRLTLYALVFVVGVLVGMEIPLVMRALNQREARFAELVSRVLTFDYLGALAYRCCFHWYWPQAGGWPARRCCSGCPVRRWWTCRVFRHELLRPAVQYLRSLVVVMVLGGGFMVSDMLTHWNEKAIYGDEVIHAETTPTSAWC